MIHEEKLIAEIAQLTELLSLNKKGEDRLKFLVGKLSEEFKFVPTGWFELSYEKHSVNRGVDAQNFLKIAADSFEAFPQSGIENFVDFFEINLLRHTLKLPPSDSKNSESEEFVPVINEREDLSKERDEANGWLANFKRLSSGYYSFLEEFEVLPFEECKKLAIQIVEEEKNSQAQRKIDSSYSPKDIFVMHNLRLVRNMALRMKRTFPTVEIEDLFQMGVLGLIRAVEKWDWTKGFQFSTYAVWWIKQSMHRMAVDSDLLIRIPVHRREEHLSDLNNIRRSEDIREFGFSKSDGISRLGESPIEQKIADFENQFIGHESMSSLTYRNGEFRVRISIPFRENISDSSPEFEVEESLLLEQLLAVLNTLTSREAGVIAMRFGLELEGSMTLDEIGKIYGVTRERIRQIEGKAMSKLRHPSRSDALRDFLE